MQSPRALTRFCWLVLLTAFPIAVATAAEKKPRSDQEVTPNDVFVAGEKKAPPATVPRLKQPAA